MTKIELHLVSKEGESVMKLISWSEEAPLPEGARYRLKIESDAKGFIVEQSSTDEPEEKVLQG